MIVAVLAGLVAASPWALRLLDGSAREWNRLSMIGQTYGAASALIAVVALVGVVASLMFQAKENKSNREESARAFHTELLKMAMDDDTYRRCWGPSSPPTTPTPPANTCTSTSSFRTGR